MRAPDTPAERRLREIDDAVDEADALRTQLEQQFVRMHLQGATLDNLVQRYEDTLFDLCDHIVACGNQPSRWLFALVASMLKAECRPHQGSHAKQRALGKKRGWLIFERHIVDEMATTMFKNASNPRTKAERAVAEALGLKDETSLRRIRARYRKDTRSDQ